MPSTTTAEKAELRRRARQYLRELSPQARRASDDALFARFLALPQVEAADTLLLYHGMGGEPDTARLLPALWARGKAVCLPRCLPGRGLEARLVRPDSALIPHPYGMLEPGEDCPLVGKDAIGLVLVPGLAFDPSGGRLGQGAGFYDRWLADYAGCTAALCRTALLLPQVPRAPHDRGVELVLTEHGLYRADAQRSGAPPPPPPGGGALGRPPRAHTVRLYSRSASLRPVGVAAKPPLPVSRSEAGKASPTARMASMTSSQGMALSTPDRAISAQDRALTAPITFRLTQGTSTSPATGSHTSPRVLDRAMAQAWAIWLGVPPIT